MTDQLRISDSGGIESQPLTSDGEPVWSQDTVREGLFSPEPFEQMRGQTALETDKLRKHTVFEPCKRHAPAFARESRYRRAETMCEGGYPNSPCEDGQCRMRPGTDFYTAEFVSEHSEGCGIQG